ncbi:MAG: hypothetical protein U0694_26240 [Anaerolineae bacterium]
MSRKSPSPRCTPPIDGVVLEVNVQAGDQAAAFEVVITLALPEPLEMHR